MDIPLTRFLLHSALILSLTFSLLSKPLTAQNSIKPSGVLVKYAPGISLSKKEQVKNSLIRLRNTLETSSLEKSNSTKKESLDLFKSVSHELDLFTLDPGQSLQQFLNSPEISGLRNTGHILAIEPNSSFKLSAWPGDIEFDKQWALNNIGEGSATAGADIDATKAWDIQTNGKGILGLIDTGIDYTHPDLVNNIWQNLAEDADGDGKVLELINGKWQLDPGDLDSIDADGNGYIDDLIGWDFINNDNNPFDDNGHGTHIAGIVGASGDNSLGIAGVNWNTNMMALKAFNEYGFGSLSDILPALAYARKMGVLLTNNSWGGSHKSEFLLEEIIAARDKGQIFVAAAGNGGYLDPTEFVFPASYEAENILSVAASDFNDLLASFSSSGQVNVDLAAPGEKIYSTLPGNTYGYKSGTSMAAGFVSGTVLLLKGSSPNLSIGEIISRIQLNVDVLPSLYGTCRSKGRLNLFKTIRPPRNRNRSSSLYASFDGPHVSCINTPLNFINTSLIPNLSDTEVEWLLNGQSIGTDTDLSYTFVEPGWYEIKLIITDGDEQSESMLPVEISLPASADLGPDTSLCASTFVLSAGQNIHTLRWTRLLCPDNTICMGAEDFTTLDPIHFNIYGGNTNGFTNRYIITDTNNQILRTANNPDFEPLDAAGSYRFYSIHQWPGIAVGGLDVGNFITDIDLGIDSCGKVSSAHEFRVWDAVELGNKPFLSVKESGIYILDVQDVCGNLVSDTLLLQLSGDCVWPGDVNADGKVSMADFLCLGIANQKSGPARPQIGTDWAAQTSINWASRFHEDNQLGSGINLKHADVNGDGKIDLQEDLHILKSHLGFLHEIEDTPIEDGPSIYIDHLNTTFSLEGDTAKIDIGIYLEGKNNSLVSDVYGMAFNLNFSDPVALEPKIIPSNSWLGPMESMSLFTDGNISGIGAQNLPTSRETFGFGMISSGHISYTGRGLIASGNIIVIVDDIVEDSLRTGYSSFGISPHNIVLIDSIGRILSSLSTSSLNTFTVDINWPSPPISWRDFQAWYEAKDIVLRWNTIGERLLDKFIVERSIDGFAFEQLAEITTQAKKDQGYSYRDIQVADLGNQELFYRIKRLDIAGNSTFSKTLRLGRPEQLTDKLLVFPNPLKDQMLIQYATLSPESASIQVINGLGQKISSYDKLDTSGEIEINSRNWPSGVYFIRLYTQLGIQVFKTFKQ